MRDPGLPANLDIIPRVARIGVTSSRTALHLAAVRALAARTEVAAFALSLPSPITNSDLADLLAMLGPKLTSLEVQQVGVPVLLLSCTRRIGLGNARPEQNWSSLYHNHVRCAVANVC